MKGAFNKQKFYTVTFTAHIKIIANDCLFFPSKKCRGQNKNLLARIVEITKEHKNVLATFIPQFVCNASTAV
jgi:hypothetical protein